MRKCESQIVASPEKGRHGRGTTMKVVVGIHVEADGVDGTNNQDEILTRVTHQLTTAAMKSLETFLSINCSAQTVTVTSPK